MRAVCIDDPAGAEAGRRDAPERRGQRLQRASPQSRPGACPASPSQHAAPATHRHLVAPAVVIHSVVALGAGAHARARFGQQLLVEGEWVVERHVRVRYQHKPAARGQQRWVPSVLLLHPAARPATAPSARRSLAFGLRQPTLSASHQARTAPAVARVGQRGPQQRALGIHNGKVAPPGAQALQNDTPHKQRLVLQACLGGADRVASAGGSALGGGGRRAPPEVADTASLARCPPSSQPAPLALGSAPTLVIGRRVHIDRKQVLRRQLRGHARRRHLAGRQRAGLPQALPRRIGGACIGRAQALLRAAGWRCAAGGVRQASMAGRQGKLAAPR